MTQYYLFLDDIRVPTNVYWIPLPSYDWIIVRSFEEFKNTVLLHGIPTFVTYDHDLSESHYGHGLHHDPIPYEQYTEKTGYDCCKFLVEQCDKIRIKHPKYTVHSLNPIGKQNIVSYVESYNKSF